MQKIETTIQGSRFRVLARISRGDAIAAALQDGLSDIRPTLNPKPEKGP